GIVLFQSVEPQDTRHHQVLGRRKRIVGLAWNAALINSSARQTAADFLHYAKMSSGCLVAPLLRPDAESRSGHRVAADWALAFLQGEPLISNRDVYLSWHQISPAIESAIDERLPHRGCGRDWRSRYRIV